MMDQLTMFMAYALDCRFVACYIKEACCSNRNSPSVIADLFATDYFGYHNITCFKAVNNTIYFCASSLKTIFINAAHLA